MYKLCIYVDKLDTVEIIAPEVETLPICVLPKKFDPFEPPEYGTKLLWPRIFELNPKISISTLLCNYSLRRALEPQEKKLEEMPSFAPAKKSHVLFLLAVPNDFSLLELADWLGTAAARIKAIKMVILGECTGFYSMLLYFDSLTDCEAIYEYYNGRLFREDSSEVALLVFISQILYVPIKEIVDTKGLIKDSIPLPQCPLCIERLDVSVSGLSTLTSSDVIGYIYSHNSKGWSQCEEVCKVCKILASATAGKPLICPCGTKESIWACLICGYLGCGRYQNGHAAKHFMETGHCFAVDIESGRIWHYLEDGYVHRILKTSNLAPIEAFMGDFTTPGNPEELSDKIENTLREYNHLLTAQLEDQRNYFEEKLKNCKKAFEDTEEMRAIKGKFELISKEVLDVKARRKKLRKENKALEKQNEILKAKSEETDRFLELRAVTKNNLLKQIKELESTEKEEEKENTEIRKKVKAIEELEREVADLYTAIH